MNTKYAIPNTKYELTIGWLYPELMSTYGDRGNIIVLTKRCEWRGIQCKVVELEPGFKSDELNQCDLLFMGGAQDRQQKIVSKDLKEKSKILTQIIEDGTPGLYICGAYQFLGNYYKEANGTIIEGLGIFDLYTENPGVDQKRLIGNIAIEVNSILHIAYSKNAISDKPYAVSILVGFENHGGRTYLGNNISPLAQVLVGYGNNGDQPRLDGGQAGDKTEGAVYKNSFGTYLHGPILPKNPHFADYLISKALEKKYKTPIHLSPLDDSLEWQAHNFILNRLGV